MTNPTRNHSTGSSQLSPTASPSNIINRQSSSPSPHHINPHAYLMLMSGQKVPSTPKDDDLPSQFQAATTKATTSPTPGSASSCPTRPSAPSDMHKGNPIFGNGRFRLPIQSHSQFVFSQHFATVSLHAAKIGRRQLAMVPVMPALSCSI